MNTNFRTALATAQITVDVVTFTIDSDTLKVLAIKRGEEPFQGQWALPGGFLWEGESTLEAAQRVLADKAGVSNIYVEQLYTFDEPGRDPRGQIVSVTYYALVNLQALHIHETGGTQQPALLDVRELPELAFDHTSIVHLALARLAGKLSYTNVAYSLLPTKFTFAELQRVYETILGQPVDRRNFRKKVMSLGIIKTTGERFSGARHRPAELFEFSSTHPQELNRWF